MSRSDTDSNSESYKSLSDEDGKMLTAKEDDSTSEMESSDETVEPEMEAKNAVKVPAEVETILGEEVFTDATDVAVDAEDTAGCTTETTTATPATITPTTTPTTTPTETPTPDVEPDEDADETPTNIPDTETAETMLTSADFCKSNIEIGSLSRTKYSRAEKKARRLLIKQGAKPLPNISRLVMRQGMVLFVIEDAEIYKNPRSDTFIVFGEVKIEDVGKQQENILACSQIKAAQTISEAAKLHDNKPIVAGCDGDGGVGAEDFTEEGLDEAGIDPTDIKLVMSQASTTRAKAVRALRANNNDIVNAIMELTM